MEKISSVKADEKCLTNWAIFDKAGLVPSEIVCQGYFPVHRSDIACHSRLPLQAGNIESHVLAEHGGGFRFTLRKSDGKGWSGWKEFAEKKLELHDFRCDICDKEMPMNVRAILKHMEPHSGKSRRPQPGGKYMLTFSFDRPIENVDDEF
jgi:hypothetical protein